MPTRDVKQAFSLDGRQVALHEQMPMIEEIRVLLLEALFLSREALCSRGRGATRLQFRHRCRDGLSDLGDGLQDGLRQLRQNMELADLVWDVAEDRLDGVRIERRAIRGDAQDLELASVQLCPESSEEPLDVFFRGVVVQDLVDKASERVIVDDGEDAVGTVVELVGREVPGEAIERQAQVLLLNLRDTFFSPPPRPNFGSWRRARTLGGLATSARRQSGTEVRPLPRCGRRWPRRGACRAPQETRGPTCPP